MALSRQIFHTLTGGVTVKVLGAVVTMLIIRHLPVEDYAVFTAMFSAGMAFYSVIGPALNRIYIIEGESLQINDPSEFLAVQTLGFGLLVLIAVPLLVLFDRHAYLLACGFAVAKLFSDFARNHYLREREFRRAAGMDIFRSLLVLFLLSIATLVASVKSALLIVCGFIASDTLIFVYAYTKHRWRFAIDARHFRILRQFTHPPISMLFGYLAIQGVFAQFDILSLSYLSNERELATFGAAVKVYGLLLTLLTSVNSVYLPSIARSKNVQEMRSLYSNHFKMIPTFCLGVVALCISADWWMSIIDGGKYPGAIAAFRILAISAVISFALNPYINIVLQAGQYGYLLRLALICHCTASPLRAYLAAHHGASGAAMGLGLTLIILNYAVFRRGRAVLDQACDDGRRLRPSEVCSL